MKQDQKDNGEPTLVWDIDEKQDPVKYTLAIGFPDKPDPPRALHIGCVLEDGGGACCERCVRTIFEATKERLIKAFTNSWAEIGLSHIDYQKGIEAIKEFMPCPRCGEPLTLAEEPKEK